MFTTTKTIYYIRIIDVNTGKGRIYDSEEINKMFNEKSDIRDSSLFRLLYSRHLKFECDEDYKLFGFPNFNEDWDELFNMKEKRC